MRDRTPYPTTSPTPSAPRFSITEKGLRACGAFTMEKATTDLRQLAQQLEQAIPEAARALQQTAADLEQAAQRLLEEVPPPPDATGNSPGLRKIRRGTVCGRFRNESNVRVSDLRLSGLWLKAAGFDLGQKYEVAVETGKLTVVATERRWSESRSAIRREKQPRAQKSR